MKDRWMIALKLSLQCLSVKLLDQSMNLIWTTIFALFCMFGTSQLLVRELLHPQFLLFVGKISLEIYVGFSFIYFFPL